MAKIYRDRGLFHAKKDPLGNTPRIQTTYVSKHTSDIPSTFSRVSPIVFYFLIIHPKPDTLSKSLDKSYFSTDNSSQNFSIPVFKCISSNTMNPPLPTKNCQNKILDPPRPLDN